MFKRGKMTHPTSVDMTLDTSLVETNDPNNPNPSNVNTSFSTTDSGTISEDLYPDMYPPPQQAGEESTPTIPQTEAQLPSLPSAQSASTLLHKNSKPVQNIDTKDAYDQWSAVYDTDGNMLQAIDDLELQTLLPTFLSQCLPTQAPPNQPTSPTTTPTTLSLIDLGCGTGRTTSKLLSYPWPFLSSGTATTRAVITGLDFSSGMLDIAATKLSSTPYDAEQLTFQLAQCDCFPTATNPLSDPLPTPMSKTGSLGLQKYTADAVLSTLVLEHVPLPAYFSTLSALLKTGGYALVTNMHSDMGQVSQAGFVNEQGVKVRGTSFAHTVEETVGEAARQGFEVVSVKERRMEEEDVKEGRVGERGWKWVGVRVWYAVVVRKL
jgi:SAM-dependent methyltransferase